jgi:hypothetical protein
MESLKKTLDKPLKATTLLHITKENQMSLTKHPSFTSGPLKDRTITSEVVDGDSIVMIGGVQVAIIRPNSGQTVESLLQSLKPKE